jgi:hypothetical protein
MGRLKLAPLPTPSALPVVRTPPGALPARGLKNNCGGSCARTGGATAATIARAPVRMRRRNVEQDTDVFIGKVGATSAPAERMASRCVSGGEVATLFEHLAALENVQETWDL